MRKCILLIMFVLLDASTTGLAQEFNEIEYLCADWGPAMTMSTKTNERTQFSETAEEVYFLKQMTHMRREKLSRPDLFSGSTTRDVCTQRSVYLCKMKPDGNGKTELKELWSNPNYPVDTQGQSIWMNVNVKTRKITVAITYAGTDMTGLWTMNLDGSGLKCIIKPAVSTNYLQAINHPSWTPNGDRIVFEEILRGTNPNQYRIVTCDRDGKNIIRLTNGPHDQQPSVSPDGVMIAYVVISETKGGLWFMDADGRNAHPLPNPDDKRKVRHSGLYPAWSPEGKRIFYMGISCCIADVISGKKMSEQPGLCGWSHWGRLGLIGFNVGGILYTDVEHSKESKWLASSGLANCSDSMSGNGKW